MTGCEPNYWQVPTDCSASSSRRVGRSSGRRETESAPSCRRFESESVPDTRLIERWLPIAEIGEESTRERRSMTALPPTYYLHVWWARRPLVASRAAVLASLLPADADRKRFLHVLGIHGDPVAAKKRIAEATRKGERLGAAAYGYARAFSYTPDSENREWLRGKGMTRATVLDPTAGGGSIPFEAVRCGLSVLANDLNPVAVLIERATVEWPTRHGLALNEAVEELGTRFAAEVRRRLDGLFPAEPQHQSNVRPDGYLWARTVTCPYCEGLVPLSPNWRLAPGGTGVRVLPQCASGPGSEGRVCSFEIVNSAEEQSGGTVARGSGLCPFPDCGRVIDGNAIKKRAQDGRMGDQLYAVVYKKEIPVQTKTGKTRWKWVRCFRATRPEDDNSAHISARLAEKMPEWEALDIVPSERFPANSNDDRPIQYGMPLWRDLFSPRQLLCHGTSVEVFREMLDADRDAGELTAVLRAAYGYLALTLDTALNYNNRAGRWDSTTGRVRSMFDRHDYAFVWSYAEMAPLVTGLGYDWAVEKTTKCIRELVSLVRPPSGAPANGLFAEPTNASSPPPLTITCKPGHDLDHIADASVDVVVMDPPYYDNVMYAELSDFFYVWLKRTAGHVFPELFRRRLTDKENEAVANLARFAGQKGAKARAGRDYQERMAAIFAECRRVLKPDGVMTLMFTHKATGAWDALTTGLIEAGFVITASWPINTEAQGSLHIKDKAAANSTIFLVCRPRTSETAADPAAPTMAAEPVATYEGSPIAVEPSADLFWEDIEPTVAHAVRRRVREFQEAGIAGVDLYLASFGPALEEFSRRWPLRRGRPRVEPARLRGTRKQDLFSEARDPYAAVPEDALDVARREVKRWRLQQLTEMEAGEDLDPTTAFFVLAWDAFKAPAFAYDEALRLARAAGVDLDGQIVGHLGEKRGSDLHLWDSSRRAAAGALGPPDGSRGMVDALHYAANRVRRRTLDEAMELLRTIRLDAEPRFLLALKAVLEVLPLPGGVTGAALSGAAAGFGSDFEALNRLRRFGFRDRAKEPRQLSVWEQTAS